MEAEPPLTAFPAEELLALFPSIMHLSIQFSEDLPEEICNEYCVRVADHNENVLLGCVDAGFNLMFPETATLDHRETIRVDFGVRCEAHMLTKNYRGENVATPTAFFLHPRSSIGKVKPRMVLANGVGVIDMDYRGPICGMFHILYEDRSDKETHHFFTARHSVVQLCAPSLVPIWVTVVEKLSPSRKRGEGGFGSTGL